MGPCLGFANKQLIIFIPEGLTLELNHCYFCNHLTTAVLFASNGKDF
jgi:hypothetical protein